jgi:DNA (cytosine-5)-methyltransferase 1
MLEMIAESYTVHGSWVRRNLTLGSTQFACRIKDISALENSAPPWERWWRSYLRGSRPNFDGPPIGNLSIVDLFCGCGGLTLGVQEAACAAGLRTFVRLALDIDREGLEVYAENFAPQKTLCTDAGRVVDFKVVGWADTARFAYPPEPIHSALRAVKGSVDLVLAGPPCEGHSNLNNRTRRADPRNLLYLDAIAAAVAMNASAIIVENVTEVLKDRSRVVDTAIALLAGSGFRTTHGVLSADELGLPQTRKRFFLVGSRQGIIDLGTIAKCFARPPTTVRWAIEDLADTRVDSVIDSVPVLSSENRRRIDYLFENNLYDLPDHMRPQCHRNGHTYPSVYGRLHWDAPAGTITTGFVTPGRGRFIHPSQRRPLTAHEAARLQGFPDWFRFGIQGGPDPTRNALAKWIGDAVPPLLGYVAGLSVLGGTAEKKG